MRQLLDQYCDGTKHWVGPGNKQTELCKLDDRTGDSEIQSAYIPSSEILTYMPISNKGSVMESLFLTAWDRYKTKPLLSACVLFLVHTGDSACFEILTVICSSSSAAIMMTSSCALVNVILNCIKLPQAFVTPHLLCIKSTKPVRPNCVMLAQGPNCNQ